MGNEEIKEVIAKILYLESTSSIEDVTPLFTELGLSSIDYIDLCFELQQKSGKNITPETLWPVNKMMLEKQYFENSQWTDDGWKLLSNLLNLKSESRTLPFRDLYKYFTVNYLKERIACL